MKTNKTLIKELRQELHFHQQMVRVDIRSVKAGIRKCKEIGAKMRQLQQGGASKPADPEKKCDVLTKSH